jgi:hypothetical protein
MFSVEATPPKTQILQSIKDFLERESLPPQPRRQCLGCASSMQFVDARFMLRSIAMNWNVALPFCPVCDQEILKDLPLPETIY